MTVTYFEPTLYTKVENQANVQFIFVNLALVKWWIALTLLISF